LQEYQNPASDPAAGRVNEGEYWNEWYVVGRHRVTSELAMSNHCIWAAPPRDQNDPAARDRYESDKASYKSIPLIVLAGLK
jgi:hypothetical protein